MEQQRLHQEERVRRALERAKAEPKKKVKTIISMGIDITCVISKPMIIRYYCA